MPINQTISSLPIPGKRGVDAREVFVDKTEAFHDTLTDTTVTQLNTAFGQINTTEANINNKEASAVASAATAEAAANSATATANASLWVSGQSYTAGQNSISPIDFQTYRATTATSGITDPSLSADWTLVIDLSSKQDTLISGTNIKTINGGSVLGSGDLVIGSATDYQEFTTSGTWTKPAGINYVYVELLGGGGSGGKGTGATSNTTRQGGGGGEFVSKLLSASSLASTVTVTIGAGGAGKTIDGHGDNGGATSFSTITAFGGKGGGGTTNNYRGSPRDPKLTYGAGTPGETLNMHYISAGMGSSVPSASIVYGYSIYGGGGGSAAFNTITSSAGGASEFAGAGGASVTDVAALVDGTYPAGGGGASNGSFASGSGAAGRVRVWAW